ncbi:hypothetical protein RYX56_19135 [Alkalihalophilus lindianensis]|uniref:PD-(D/E)XK nuclease superfamily protein n=1 Tax=Alkalihalophilus lindianensis TaxID=1630542 RepID=A0ABU3XF71_9BACI|nr:hypothetical protein [Alkalihalophilus lindianensis]MDV2686488.1 hypothetical protein [Alkalihalophilus lindianensis]
MLLKPKHAECENREKLSKKHQIAGDAEDWFSRELLNKYQLSGVTFDFFVNWKNWTHGTLSNELWVKRNVSEEQIPSISTDAIQNLIYSCDSEEFVKDLALLAKGSLKYKLFRESVDWESQTDDYCPILSVDIDITGKVSAVNREKLSCLMKQIKTLSGGTVRVGGKGLFYSYTKLECYLSKTDAAWPGDADLILLDSKKKPIAILEFKKHTKLEAIESHKFEKYYKNNGSDKRKYNRLAILRDALGDIPLLVIYYPTREEHNYILIDEVLGEVGDLSANREWSLDLPVDEKSQRDLIEKIIEIVMEE